MTLGDRLVLRSDIIHDVANKVDWIRKHLKIAKSWQKKYADVSVEIWCSHLGTMYSSKFLR